MAILFTSHFGPLHLPIYSVTKVRFAFLLAAVADALLFFYILLFLPSYTTMDRRVCVLRLYVCWMLKSAPVHVPRLKF